MLSRIIKKKIEVRFKSEIKYAYQCSALAADMSSVCNCTISVSTIKRLFGFIKVTSDAIPRVWTLDLIAEYIGYKSFDELQNELAGNKTKKKKRIEFLDCDLIKPGKKITLMFGKISTVKLECISKNRFRVLDEIKTDVKTFDEIEVQKILIDLPLLIKVHRTGATTTGIILGGISGVTDISIDDINKSSINNSNGLLTSKS